MDHNASKWRVPASARSAEDILEGRYPQLLKWGELLTHGDRGAAREIVHDLCLQLALSQPDFSAIANLDGYLYTCLRHVYLSRVTRASREAVRFVSIGDCDSVQLAFADGRLTDSLDTQNELRRICCYAVWRKNSAKGFSYFILHFFHGYFHGEIAELACLPTAAIYNKLKTARTELRPYLGEPGKLRIAKRDAVPEPILLPNLLSSPDLFRELRQTILNAKIDDCMQEEELISLYEAPVRMPLSCTLLSHIVSCERCLAIVDRHFRRPTLKDRDSLDGVDRSPSLIPIEGEVANTPARATLEQVRWRGRRIYEHRPATLSIAVNGKILASHDVQTEHSLLSARIERPDSAHFVEVFSEPEVRLALLSIEALPPEGPHALTQHVVMSDDRWLELRLAFDGLGLDSQLAYFDPALAVDTAQEISEEVPALSAHPRDEQAPFPPETRRSTMRLPSAVSRFLQALRPSSVPGWAFAMGCVLCLAGYLSYRYTDRPVGAQAILDQSIKIEGQSMQGQAKHEIMRLEDVAADGHPLAQGTIDLWKDGSSKRYMRRLYDSNHRLIAADWQTNSGQRGSYSMKDAGAASAEDHQLAANGIWMQEVSSRAFRAMADTQVQVRAVNDGYELAANVNDSTQPQLVSATLVLNRRLLPVGETLRMGSRSVAHALRFTQTEYVSKPSSSVPDSVFSPNSLDRYSRRDQGGRSSILPPLDRKLSSSQDTRSAELEIAVLYQLHKLGADSGQPIQAERTTGGRIRVVGAVVDNSRRDAIVHALQALPDHQDLDLHLTSQEATRIPENVPQTTLPPTRVYNVVQAEPPAAIALRKHFEAKGWKEAQIDSAIAQFCRDALGHAQGALQHAYALHRLGNAFTTEELRSTSVTSQRQWTEMVSNHSSALQGELRALSSQLAEIEPAAGPSSNLQNYNFRIDSPTQFSRAADQLLRRTQTMNQSIANAFASGANSRNDAVVTAAAENSVPLQEAAEIAAFATRLTNSETQARIRNPVEKYLPPIFR